MVLCWWPEATPKVYKERFQKWPPPKTSDLPDPALRPVQPASDDEYPVLAPAPTVHPLQPGVSP